MSNTLVVQNNNTGVDVKRISSREVAEMMELRHDALLRKIDNINKVLSPQKCGNEKSSPQKCGNEIYWVESNYIYNGRTLREYLVSKEGCEFLAHKSTGEKGILFTHRYMERFKEMEQIIEQGSQQVITAKQVEEIATTVATTVATTIATTILERLNKIIPYNTPKSEQISFINTPLRTPYTATKIGKQINRKPETINKAAARHGIITKTNNGWVLNKKYEEAGYGKTCKGGQYEGTFVRYSEKGKQEIIKIFK